MASIVFTTIATISENVPKDNVFAINKTYQTRLLSFSLVVILTVSSVYIVRYLAQSIENLILAAKYFDYYNDNSIVKTWKYTPLMVMIFRSLLTIVVPFAISIFLLNHCGGGWTIFWNKCSSNSTDFDVVNIYHVSYSFSVKKVKILQQNDVCNQRQFSDIITHPDIRNPCLRQFWDWWIPIVCLKLGLLTLNIMCKICIWKY